MVAAPSQRRKAVFLDRDGVINRSLVRDGKPYAPETLEQFELLPGAADAMRDLRAAGWLVIVATNQPDLATGKVAPETLDAMHDRLRAAALVDDIRVCPHQSSDHCICRKPKPGLLLAAAADWFIDLAASFMVGDRWRDVAAAQAAGCQALFIDYGYAEQQPAPPYRTVASLAAARDLILAHAI